MRILPLLVLALAATAAGADAYRWTDPATGRTIISDTPPPTNAKGVNQVRAEAAPGNLPSSFAAKRAAENFPVNLFTTPDCASPCQQARDLLSGRNVPYTEKMLRSADQAEELKKLVGDTVVPVLQVGKETARGFEAQSYHKLLDLAGYPGSPNAGGAAK